MARKKFVLYCNTEADWVHTDWVSSVPTECPNNASHEIDNDSIAEIEQEATPVKEIHIPCGSLQKAWSKVDDTTWTTIRKIVFPGTSRVGTPNKVAFYVGPSSGGTMDVRLVDLDNNKLIASKTGLTAEDVYVDNSTANWPELDVVLGLQMKVSTDGETAYVSDTVILFFED